MATYFLDENLDGKTFRSVLTWAGVPFLGASDRGLRGQPDALWTPMVSAEGLVIVTSDVRTRFQPAEKAALVVSRARVIYLTQSRSSTHTMLAQNFVNAQPAIRRFISRNEAPWLATLNLPVKLEDIAKGVPGSLRPQRL